MVWVWWIEEDRSPLTTTSSWRTSSRFTTTLVLVRGELEIWRGLEDAMEKTERNTKRNVKASMTRKAQVHVCVSVETKCRCVQPLALFIYRVRLWYSLRGPTHGYILWEGPNRHNSKLWVVVSDWFKVYGRPFKLLDGKCHIATCSTVLQCR